MPLAVTPSVDNIIIGGPTEIAISPYVATRGAGTFTVLGKTVGGAEFLQKRDRYEVSPDDQLGAAISEPIKAEGTLKFALLEATLKNLAYVLGLDPAVYVTGTTPNFTLKSNYSARGIYNQMKVTGRGHGATSIRTWTGWRCVPGELEPFAWKKDGETVYRVTFNVIEESETPANGAWQMVDS